MRTNPASWLLAALLAGSACSAHAEPTTWDFSYTGFFSTLKTYSMWDGESYTEGFEPDARITGSFSGQDDNGDGLIELAELDAFTVHGRDYFDCMANPSPYGSCSIRRFTYALTGELDFSAGWSGHDEFYSGWSGGVTAGDRAVDASYGHFTESTRYLYWTDQTRFSIVPAPVPEPGAGAMAVAGMMLLAGLRRRLATQTMRAS